ncbi:MAG TPA: phosphoribosyltransferase [Gemmatimonadaceae bacterium]|nr:phosphoribosyltransferase [Gemmatimonadaceae bacterium]
MITRAFRDRRDAGQKLAERLKHLALDHPIVLALPRGGLPVAYEIAHVLGAPLDVLNVRKLGVPWQPELAMGAVAGGGVRVLNDDVVAMTGVTKAEVDQAAAREWQEVERRERVYREGRPAPEVAGHAVVLVDDGVATGATARGAIAVLRAAHAGRVVLAVPVIQGTVAAELRGQVDELVALYEPADLVAIGPWYQQFPQLTDAEVLAALHRASHERVRTEPPACIP